jgi:archaemetzincin
MNFTPPDQNKQVQAIGMFQRNSRIEAKAFSFNPLHFQDMGVPGPDDWLSCNHEPGQTFDKYSTKCSYPNKKQKFYIQPLGKTFSQRTLEMLQEFATLFYPGMPFVIRSPISLKSLKLKKRLNCNKEQYSGGQILKSIQGTVRSNPETYATIAVLFQDIYNREEGNFVFGLANGQSKTGVFSFARYDNRFYGLEENQNLLNFRAVKVMIHEMGHMFGLSHCIYFRCLMNGSNHMEETDNKPFLLCSVCARKIHHLLKFDVVAWYQGILNGLRKYGEFFGQFIDWYSTRVKYLMSSE